MVPPRIFLLGKKHEMIKILNYFTWPKRKPKHKNFLQFAQPFSRCHLEPVIYQNLTIVIACVVTHDLSWLLHSRVLRVFLHIWFSLYRFTSFLVLHPLNKSMNLEFVLPQVVCAWRICTNLERIQVFVYGSFVLHKVLMI
jgi:hypothetical protein